MAPAGGDQLAAIFGTWAHGLLPGITTIDHIAEDVHASNLKLPLQHYELDPAEMDGAFINSKGFGGNNATGFFLSPRITEKMLSRRWGAKRMQGYRRTNDAVATAANDYDAAADRGEVAPIYRFGEGVLTGEDLTISTHSIKIPGFAQSVRLDLDNPYEDMT
jgi:acetoacetyl-[acyl-carrier protein] synthase